MVDYSKWKNIEISDDEDDTHPNIDTPSLFRWRHQARVERMAEMERQKEEFKKRKQTYQTRLINVKDRIDKKEGKEEDLKKELEEIEKEGRDISRIEEDLAKKEKKTPWNVDTISKPGFEKTVINKNINKRNEKASEEDQEKSMVNFVKENEKLCKQYGMLRKYDDSRRFLLDHAHLVCEETANYLVIWAINLAMEEKLELMGHIAHQCICMQYILELGKQLDVDPRACVGSFFARIQDCVPQYREQFESEIEGFKSRVKKRAEEKLKEAAAEVEEDRTKVLGPGGLDPIEVFETLPDELKVCFETRNVELLTKTLASMPFQDAEYHMKRCIDAGLWVLNADDTAKADGKEKETSNGKFQNKSEVKTETERESKSVSEETEQTEDKKSEPIYSEVNS